MKLFSSIISKIFIKRYKFSELRLLINSIFLWIAFVALVEVLNLKSLTSFTGIGLLFFVFIITACKAYNFLFEIIIAVESRFFFNKTKKVIYSFLYLLSCSGIFLILIFAAKNGYFSGVK